MVSKKIVLFIFQRNEFRFIVDGNHAKPVKFETTTTSFN